MVLNPQLNYIHSLNHPFIDAVFLNSPLCQICEFANYGIGGICNFILNRRLPSDFVLKNSKVVSCSAHKNWLNYREEEQSDNLNEIDK